MPHTQLGETPDQITQAQRPAHTPHDLLHRLDDVPRGEIWVHCAAGYRASALPETEPNEEP